MRRRTFAGALSGMAMLPTLEAESARTTCRVVKDNQGRDMAVISWRARDGSEADEVDLPFTARAPRDSNEGRLGPIAIRAAALGSVPNAYEWDTRE